MTAFLKTCDLGTPAALDPPDVLREVPDVVANDPGSYYCYNHLWAARGCEDPSTYPFAFATGTKLHWRV